MSNQDGNFQKAIDSRSALVFSRFAMPILVTLVGAAGSTILFLVWNTVQDIKATQEKGTTQTWESIRRLSGSEAKLDNAVAGLSQSVADHFKADDSFENQERSVLMDHDSRLRLLEHARPN